MYQYSFKFPLLYLYRGWLWLLDVDQFARIMSGWRNWFVQINFYIKYILHGYNLIKLCNVNISSLPRSSSGVLARHLIQQLQARRKISLDLPSIKKDLLWIFQVWKRISLDLLDHNMSVAHLKGLVS